MPSIELECVIGNHPQEEQIKNDRILFIKNQEKD